MAVMDAESLRELYKRQIEDCNDLASFLHGVLVYAQTILRIPKFKSFFIDKIKNRDSNFQLVYEFYFASTVHHTVPIPKVVELAREENIRGPKVVKFRECLFNLKINDTEGSRAMEEVRRCVNEATLRKALQGVQWELFAYAKEESKERYWINKIQNEFWYNDTYRLDLPTSDNVTIFKAVYALRPMGGDIPYGQLISYLKKKGLTATRKTIQRALCGESANFFKYVKGLPRVLNDRELFKASSDGKKITFNNKR